MSANKVNIKMKLLSPLSHYSDERMGTMQVARTMKFEHEGEFLDIPIYTGNAFRGQLRRIAMRDFLEKIGIVEEGISAKLYHLFFTGGALTSGSRYTETGKKREMREKCPALSLFGTAIGDQIPEGKMKVGIFKPICKETASFTGVESSVSFYDLLEENFYTRRDDLKSNHFNINESEKHNNPVQMKYEQQNLSAGTDLVSRIIIENANEIETSCLISILDKFKEVPFIGGKSSVGHGEVDVDFDYKGNSKAYYGYLEENKEDIRAWVRELEGTL